MKGGKDEREAEGPEPLHARGKYRPSPPPKAQPRLPGGSARRGTSLEGLPQGTSLLTAEPVSFKP